MSATATGRIYPWPELQAEPGLEVIEHRRPGEDLEKDTRNRVRASGDAWCRRHCPHLRPATSIDRELDGVWVWFTTKEE